MVLVLVLSLLLSSWSLLLLGGAFASFYLFPVLLMFRWICYFHGCALVVGLVVFGVVFVCCVFPCACVPPTARSTGALTHPARLASGVRWSPPRLATTTWFVHAWGR